MKKITLLMFSLLAGITMHAQSTCATATAVSTTTNNTVAAYGTEVSTQCGGNIANGSATGSAWYTYTATATGTLNISTNLTANNNTDTRINVYTGTCSTLTCYADSDDVNYAGNNYTTNLTFNVSAGTTYYIAWDNKWSANSFIFTATFIPVACPAPTNLALTAFTTTTATISLGTVGNYEVEYGEFPYTQGSVTGGTVVNVTGVNSYQLTNLSPSVSYNVFVRKNCGAVDGFSTASTVNAGTSPSPMVSFPFSENLEPDANQALLLNLGLSFFATTNNWAFGQDNLTDGDTANDFASNGISYVFSNNTFTSTAANATVYFGPFNLTSGSIYTLNVDQRNTAAANATTPNKDMELLAAATNDGATNTVLATFDDMTNVTHQVRTGDFTPTASGNFYFGVRDKSSVLTGVAFGNSVVIDNIRLTSTLSVTDVDNVKLTHFYNLANQSFNVQSSNGSINTIEIYSLSGQEVLNMVVNDLNAKVDMNNINAGIYIAKINVDGISQSVKFIKE